MAGQKISLNQWSFFMGTSFLKKGNVQLACLATSVPSKWPVEIEPIFRQKKSMWRAMAEC
jgi:hypothetical protein